MNQDTFKQGMAGLYEYYKKDASPALSSVYWRALKHLSDDDFMHVIDSHLLASNWFPKIPELLELAPEQLALENKGSLTWCDNTQKLLDEYGVQA
jgi:hypothetical protein